MAIRTEWHQGNLSSCVLVVTFYGLKWMKSDCKYLSATKMKNGVSKFDEKIDWGLLNYKGLRSPAPISQLHKLELTRSAGT